MSDFTFNNQNISFQEVADAANKSNLSIADYIDKVDGLNYTVEPEDRGFFYDLYVSFQQGAQRGASVDEAFDIYDQGKDISDEDLQNAIDAVEKANSLGPTNEAYNYNKDLTEAGGGAFGAMKALLKNPGFIPQFMVSSLATMGSSFLDSDEVAGTTLASAGTGAAAGAFAGPVGAKIGAASGAIGGLVGAMETGLTLMELIQEEVGEGVELTKENVKEVLANEENFNKLKQRSAARGRNIGAIESLAFVLSAGATRGLTSAGKFKRAFAAGTAIEMGGGFVGEIAGQVGAEQEIDTGEALLEAVGEVAGPGQILNTSQVLAQALKGSKYNINNEKRSKQEIVDILNSETLTPEEKTKVKRKFRLKMNNRKIKY